jgi:hypothetical protein
MLPKISRPFSWHYIALRPTNSKSRYRNSYLLSIILLYTGPSNCTVLCAVVCRPGSSCCCLEVLNRLHWHLNTEKLRRSVVASSQLCFWDLNDHLCGLVVRVSDYTMEMYFASCEVRTEFIYVMRKKVDLLCGVIVSVPGYRLRGPGSISSATRFSDK